MSVIKLLSMAELVQVKKHCQRKVRRVSWISAGAAIVPVPLFDVVFDVGVLIKLVPDINQRFGLDPEQIEQLSDVTRTEVWQRRAERGSELIGMVITRELIRRSLQGMGTRIVTKQVTKFIPLGGQIVAATLGYWIMRKLAMSHVEDCFEVALAANGHSTSAQR